MIDRRRWRIPLGSAALLGSIAVALISQFLFDGWASISQLGGWIQHGVIFWGAVGVGASLLALGRMSEQRRAVVPVSTGRSALPRRGRETAQLGVALLFLGGSAALLSQFYLDDWASVSAAWDWIQHGVIFLGGMAVGASLVLLRRSSHRPGEGGVTGPASAGHSARGARRWLAAGLLSLLTAADLTGLGYLSLQGGLPIPIPISRVDVIHVASGIGTMVFAVCLVFRLRQRRPLWTGWMNGLFIVAAVLYAGVAVTGALVLLPLPADLADELIHAHLIAAVWAAEPTLALLFELGRRGQLGRLPRTSRIIGEGRRALSRRRRGPALAGLLGLLALVPAIALAVIAPRALSPAARRGGDAGWRPIGPGVIMDAATLQPGGRTVVAGGYGLYSINLDGAWRPIQEFAGQDVLSLLRAPGAVYVGTGLGLYRAPSFSGPYQRLPLPAGGVHGIAVRGSEIWASAAFRGFYVSADGGAHWRLVNAGVEDPNLAWALVNNAGTIFGSDVFGVYRFAGDRWVRVSGETGVFTFTQSPDGRLFAAGEGGGVWVRNPQGGWEESDAGLLSHNEGSLQGIHEFSVSALADERLYGASMDAGGDVSLDGGTTWSQQWPALAADGAVYRILPDGATLVAATDAGILIYRLPVTAPAGPGWWSLLIGATLAASLLAVAILLPGRRGPAAPPDQGAAPDSPRGVRASTGAARVATR